MQRTLHTELAGALVECELADNPILGNEWMPTMGHTAASTTLGHAENP